MKSSGVVVIKYWFLSNVRYQLKDIVQEDGKLTLDEM